MIKKTGFEAGFSGDEQMLIALETIYKNGGKAPMKVLYTSLEKKMNEKGYTLSEQGKASMRHFVNKKAVSEGLIYKCEKKCQNREWELTPKGDNFIKEKLQVKKDDNFLTEGSVKKDDNFLTEGEVFKKLVNKYERNANARKACISHHGTVCKICNFDFRKVYGDIGAGFIHVHHIIPLSKIGKNYKVDPIKDLVPICPNCHAMIHRRNPTFSVEELKIQMETAYLKEQPRRF
jgi:predicted HNH restriction endonuclease